MEDLTKLSAQALYESIYRPMLDAWKDAWGANVQPYLDLLENVRNKEISNSEIKANTIKMIGFDFKAEEFSSEQLTKLIDILGRFQSSRGSSSFFQLLGWVKNVPFSLVPLWTADYIDFAWDSSNVESLSVVNGGNYYPTCHVDLLYDFTQGLVTKKEIEELFYEVAPAQLVLHSVVASINIQDRFPESMKPGSSGTSASGDTDIVDEDKDEEEVPDAKVPDPDDFAFGANDPDYLEAIRKLKESTDTIFFWQNVPSFYREALTSSFASIPVIDKQASIIASHIDSKYSNLATRFPIDVRYLYNGYKRGITYSRVSRLVRVLPITYSNSVIEENEPYYTSKEGYMYSTPENFNLFLNSTKPKTQSIQLTPGVWTIWNRGYNGSLFIDFGNDNIVQQALNSQHTFTIEQTTNIVITPENGIVFVQVEPQALRSQGIYSYDSQTGVKPRDHIYTDIDKAFSCIFDFKLIAPDEVTTQEEDYKAVFSFGDVLVECKLGIEQDRSDSKIRFTYKDEQTEYDLKNFEQADSTNRLQFVISPTSIIFINMKDDTKTTFSTNATRAWFGSNFGKNNASLFIKQILMIQGDLI